MQTARYHSLVFHREQNSATGISQALSNLGFSCETSTTTSEALEKVRSTTYQLVVVDLTLTNRETFALLGAVLHRGLNVKTIAIANVGASMLVRQLLTNGVDDVEIGLSDYDVFAVKALALFELEQWREMASNPAGVQARAAAKIMLRQVESVLMSRSAKHHEQFNRVFESVNHLSSPPRGIYDFIQHLDEEQATPDSKLNYLATEKRQLARVSIQTNVKVLPVTEDQVPIGEPFKAMVCDFSEGGIRLIHTRAVHDEFLALRWRAATKRSEHITAVARVVRCRPINRFYEVGAQFVIDA